MPNSMLLLTFLQPDPLLFLLILHFVHTMQHFSPIHGEDTPVAYSTVQVTNRRNRVGKVDRRTKYST